MILSETIKSIIKNFLKYIYEIYHKLRKFDNLQINLSSLL